MRQIAAPQPTYDYRRVVGFTVNSRVEGVAPANRKQNYCIMSTGCFSL